MRFVLIAALLVTAALAAEPLRVGIDINGEPMTLVDAKGVPTGFAVELLNAIAAEMRFEVVYTAKPWAEMFDDFQAGRLDALANITYTTERAEFIDYADPHTVMNGAFFVRKGGDIPKSLSDLAKYRIAIKPGSSPYSYLNAQGLLGRFVAVDTFNDGLRAVAEGRADAALDARIIGLKNIRDHHLDNLRAADFVVPDFAQRLHIGLHRGDRARLALINEGLARVHTNGTYDRIHEKWIHPLEPPQVRIRDLRPYALPASLVLAVILGALAWQRRLLGRLARQAAALRESEERLTFVLQGSEDGFWDWDLRTGRVERSDRWAAMLGCALAEIEPTFEGGLNLVHPDDRPAYEKLRSLPPGGKSGRYDVEFRMRAKSGGWRWILNRCKIVSSGLDGTPWRIAGTHTDITDLKRVQEELASQEAQFRFIYEHAPVGLSWLRRRQAASRLVNLAHQRITGVAAADSHNTQNYIAATHPDDRDRQRHLQERLYCGDIDHFSTEKRYLHPDGTTVHALMTMHLYHDPITHEAQEVTTLVDITELKHAEEEREKLRLKMLDSQKLESLGVLAGGIAHDFNNLLTVILANASMARSEVIDPAKRAERLVHVENAARRAADLCRQMLAYAGRGNFVVERVTLGKVVQDTTRLLQVSISKKARLVLEVGTDLPPVEVDTAQLQQVVMNLVINASDALCDGTGEIRVTTRLGRPAQTAGRVVHSFDLPDGDAVCLEVSDTGQGMSAATLARVFDPFFTTKFAGRGLGLAAVLGIVRAHHGALMVESAVGEGSRFSLFLPAAPSASESSQKAPAIAAPLARGNGTILVADDEPVVLATTDHLLRSHGYRTVLASDGHDAVRQFRGTPRGFAAILLDLTMPGLDGAEALRAIREINPEVPVLVMSGYSEQDVFARMRDQGPVPVLRKPFTSDMLLSRLAEVIAG